MSEHTSGVLDDEVAKIKAAELFIKRTHFKDLALFLVGLQGSINGGLKNNESFREQYSKDCETISTLTTKLEASEKENERLAEAFEAERDLMVTEKELRTEAETKLSEAIKLLKQFEECASWKENGQSCLSKSAGVTAFLDSIAEINPAILRKEGE